MRTLGLIGGMSWQSTLPYYRIINTCVGEHHDGVGSAPLLLWSVNQADIFAMQAADQWAKAERFLAEGARRLVEAGAEGLMLCTNTMHRVAGPMAELGVPFLHITDVVADAAEAVGASTVGLLGTRFTMEADFYRDRLSARHGAAVITPDDAGRGEVHRIIYDELCQGHLLDGSRAALKQICVTLAERGAEVIILGCTELGLLLPPSTEGLPPLLDTTDVHARAGARWILGEDR